MIVIVLAVVAEGFCLFVMPLLFSYLSLDIKSYLFRFLFIDILRLGVYMIHFQMRCCALVIRLEARKNLDLHTCFQMEDLNELGEQKGFHLPC